MSCQQNGRCLFLAISMMLSSRPLYTCIKSDPQRLSLPVSRSRHGAALFFSYQPFNDRRREVNYRVWTCRSQPERAKVEPERTTRLLARRWPPFDASVDVTGAASGWGLTRVGRFQRRGFARYISGTGVSDRGVEVMQCLTLVHSHRIAGIPVSIRNSNGDAFRRSVKAECICRAI